ncbi:UvrD-helicase domain-containing protein [Mycobacterium sp. 5-140-3-2]|uniref:UvrD-helicase domain-containing protein n=1 Tax=unclassified Mycobacterium TaxID=2642494 RepID=UPI002D783487|nr:MULTISPECIES: UvrD-helicase domain-containing protein [unclassified Mycobacterium]WRU83851.1 UvrD-helicase domain-containing protein [Mycobacterium sp. 5-140-3-2]WSE40002.1 UvrD-helicase domain-containing protein [Mycobacterium sp. 5-140-3-1]
MHTDLSEEQKVVLAADVRLVEACPGAGKTRAIAKRYITAATLKGQAAALLSFTNAAVDEAARRCANAPQALEAPNFVGTFDRFLHRYLVTPALVRVNGQPPRYVDSYNDLPAAFDTRVRHRKVPGAGLALGHFHADASGNLHYPSDDPAGAPSADRAYVAQLGKAGFTPSALTDLAQRRINELTTSGIYDCEQSRLKALGILRNADAAWLHLRLTARFAEIIVDEFQDCSAIEHEILRSLETLGIRIVVVADPDQAIYEFRQAEPSSYLNYRASLHADQIVYLDDNWRSSPAICAITSSLRSISVRPIVSRRDASESPHAETVYVVAGTPAYIRGEFDRLATELNIIPSQRLILAATRKAAYDLSGRVPRVGDSTTNTSRLIRSIAILRYSPDATERKAAITVVEEILLGTIKLPSELRRAPRDEQLNAAGIDRSQLRIMVARLTDASNTWADADSATVSIRTTVSGLLSKIELGYTPTGQRFQKAKSADWSAWSRAGEATDHSEGLASAHIHAVKGGERDAVLLDIEDEPKGARPHIIELWAAPDTHEARRVLYVGASRARRLLVLAVAPHRLEALRAVLNRSSVIAAYIVE